MRTIDTLRSGPLLQKTANFLASKQLTVYGESDPLRAEVEQCIRLVYLQQYRALVPEFSPFLLALRQDKEVLAAAGYRKADQGPLFLERYLSAPIDELITSQMHFHVLRHGIVEVGHLAALHRGEGKNLLLSLGPYLLQEGFEWVVGTVTKELRILLERIGIKTLFLGNATAQALGEQAHCWGSYYDHAPVVVAINLRRSLRQYLTRRAVHTQRIAA